MSRYGNVTILPADPNPWADAFGLIGSIMGKNAADRQDVKDTDAFISSITPDNTGLLANPTIKAPNATATTGGLLQGNLKDNVTQSLAPNTSFLDNAGSPVTQGPQQQVQPFRQAPQMATMPQQAVQTTPQQTAPKTWNDVQNQYNTAWGQKLKATLANMSPEARKQYLPQIMQMREQDLANLKNDWTKKETANNWDLFNNETDPKKKLFAGVKLGLPQESMKMLLEPDTKTQLVNMGGKYVQVGTNAYTGKMMNMETGQPLTAEDLQMTMTPGQEATLAETIRHNGVMESKGGSYGGGGKSGGAVSPEAKWAQTYEISSNGLTKDQATIDSLYDAAYLTPTQQKSLNQALANRDKYWSIASGGEYGKDDTEADSDTGNSIDYNNFYAAAKKAGKSDADIRAKWQEITGEDLSAYAPAQVNPATGATSGSVLDWLNGGGTGRIAQDVYGLKNG